MFRALSTIPRCVASAVKAAPFVSIDCFPCNSLDCCSFHARWSYSTGRRLLSIMVNLSSIMILLITMWILLSISLLITTEEFTKS